MAKINSQKFQRILFYLVIITSIGVRVIFLNHKALWLDEAYSVLFCKSDLTKAKDYIFFIQGNFAGYWVIIHPILKIFKNLPIEITLRTPSLIADVLALSLFYKIIRKLLGEREARLATIFYALHPVLIWHSLDGRFYSIYLLLCLLSIYLLINIKEKKGGLYLWFLVTGIIPYFHYYGYFFFSLLAMTLFIFFPTLISESRSRLILKLLPVFIIMLPSLILFYMQTQNISTPSLMLRQDIKEMLLFILLSLIGNFHQEHLSFLIPSILLPAMLIILILSNSRFKKLYILVLLLVILVPTLTHFFTKIFFHSRFVIFSIPFFIFVTVSLFSGIPWILKNLLVFAFIFNYLLVDYFTLTITVNLDRPFTKNDLESIGKLPGNFLFIPGYLVIIFEAYNLLEEHSIHLSLPDITNKKELSIMLPREQTKYIPYLIPLECSRLKESIEKEEKINIIFSPFSLGKRENMSECVIEATRSFVVTHFNELASGIKIIQLQKLQNIP